MPLPRFTMALLAGTALSTIPCPAMATDRTGTMAAEAEPSESENPSSDSGDAETEASSGDIVVTATRGFASVLSDIPADEVLDQAAIASYGASNIGDLVAALTVQTASGRGRGSGPPVVLVNGRRVSGFGEIRNLPPEAIERVEIFPAEVALDYGFAADQRVINFTLKREFSAITAELEQGGATDGGRWAQEVEAGLFRIDGDGRININAEYNRATPLTEAERGIIQANGIAAEGELRTLLGGSDSLAIDGTIARPLSGAISGSLNLRYGLSETRSLQGPRRLDSDEPLRAESDSETFHAGLSSDGRLGRWRWTLTGNYDRSQIDVTSERDDPAGGALLTDQTRQIDQFGDANVVLNGPLFELPAGNIRATVQGGAERRDVDSRSERGGATVLTSVARNQLISSGNIDVPIASRDRDVLAFVGDLSLNGRVAYSDLSDFGGLTDTTVGINWSPVERLDIVASWVNEETAPALIQLGAPQLTTPLRTIFDFASGQTVLADVISGGNPDLLAETKRDFRLQANWRPIEDTDFLLTASYARTRSRNTTAEFPLLTPEIEAAFPGRVVRDASGQIVSVDQRPVNFEATFGRQIRYGASYAKSFGQPQRGAGGPGIGGGRPPGVGGGGGGGGRPPGAGGGGRGRGSGGGPFGGPGAGGRWNIAIYHTVRFEDEVVIRSGVPVLDLLDGSAIGPNGGAARHEVELDGGWFNNGIGFRLGGFWRQGSTVVGGPVAGGGTASDLVFSDRMSLNFRAFADLSRVFDGAVFRNSRLRLAVDNIFNDRQSVRDATGVIPLRYQQGYLDPQGRYIELSLQKRF